ncbi:PilW family protein [Pseudoxanthomonas kaohsiungensis]|uniref:PilW family protein n=1 Tax=Pseudoxanthomonas kaohsiungensis TaxID=283923 RepID=UPI0035B123B0
MIANFSSSFRRRQAGLSLIELMIALLIGSILLIGLVQVFGASRTAYQTSEGLARVQENARFAIDYLQRDIRMAGHFGCVNDQAHWVKGAGDLVNHLGTTPAALDFGVSISGYEASNTAPGQVVTSGSAATGWSPALPAQIAALNPSPGSDIIALRFLAGEGVPATALVNTGSDTAVTFPSGRAAVLTSEGVSTPSLFGVADCSHVDVFQGAISGATVQSSGGADFAAQYTTSPSGQTLLYRAESIVFYVAPGASGQPALWRARANAAGAYPAAAREELVEGIESLQFLYGQDATAVIDPATPPVGNITSQDTAETLTADVNEWRRVGLVQIGVLAVSPNPAAAMAPGATATQPRVLGVRFAPPATADARIRNGYEVTVALRNRLFGN